MNQNIDRLGTKYGGWILPKDIELNEDSVVYSAGVGEDISFDILLSDKYKCNIVLIDATKRAKKHYDEVCYYYDKIKWKMSGDIQDDYYGVMYPLKPDMTKITYIDKCLWDEKKEDMKFYKQDNEQVEKETLLHEILHVALEDKAEAIFNLDEKVKNKEENLIRLLSPSLMDILENKKLERDLFYG